MEASPVQIGKHILDLVHLTFSTVYQELNLVGNQTITDYLLNHHYMTHQKFKREFTINHRQMLASNNIGDVTLIYKLLKMVCGLAPCNSSVWNTPADTLEFRLRKTKNLWIDLIHIMENSPQKVIILCSELEELLEQILKKVEEKTGRHLYDVRKQLTTEYLPQSISNWELYIPVFGQFIKVIFTMVYKHYNRCNLGIKDFCFQKLGFNETTYRKTFLKTQRQQIELHRSIDELDPVTLYRVLEKVVHQEDVLYGILKSMKNMRNEAIHIRGSNDFESKESAYNMFTEVLTVLHELGARSGQKFYDIMAQMGKELYPEATIAFSVQSNTLSSFGATVSTSTVPQPTCTAVTATTIVPPPSATVPSSSAAVPSSTTVPSAAVPSSTTVPSAAVPSSTTVPSSSAVPSSTSAVPSSTTVPSAAVPSSTTVPSSAVPSSTTVPSSSAVPSSTTVPSSSAVPSSTTVPSSAVPSSTTVPSSSAVPSSTSVPSSSAVPSSTNVPSSAVPSSTTVQSSSAVPSSTTVPSATVPSSSTALDTSVYKKEDLNMVRAFAALRRGGPAVKTFAKLFKELFPKGLRHLEEHCKSELGYKEKALKSIRKELEEPIEKDMKPTDLDISCLYKCLGCVGLLKQEKWSTPAKTLEHYLYLVKMKRNFLAHEVVRYTDSDLAQLFDDLQRWLLAILRLLGNKCGKDMSGMISGIKKELHYIYKEPLPVEDINDYYQRIQEIRKALTTGTLARARVEIKEHYADSRYKVVTPVTWSCHSSHTNWDINELYTELKIIDSSGFSGVTETVSGSKLFLQLSSTSKILLVEGMAGSGKTSLCKFAVHRWKNMSHDMDGLVDVDLLIFIQCRHVYSETLTAFLSEDLLKETFRDVDRDDVILSLSEARLLFVVDGFDEARPAARTLLHEALTKFPSSAFIITTRPEFRSDVMTVISETTGSQSKSLFRIIGFEDTKRGDYVRKLFSVLEGDPDPFLRYLRTIDRYLGSFTLLPLTLALLVLLWNDDIKKVSEATTVTGIYKEILMFFQKRLVARQKNRSKETRHSKDIERKIKKWLQTLAGIAWRSLQGNVMSLTEEDEETLRDKSDEFDIDSTDALSCLLQCNTMVTQSQDYENWEFFHKTIQEFLAASHLSSDVIEKNVSLDNALEFPQSTEEKLNKTREYSRLIQFIAGLLVEADSMTEVRAQEVLQLFNFHLPWTFDSITDLSRECKSSSKVMMGLSNMFREEILQDYLEGYEPESLHCVLQKTALSLPESVTIKISSSDAGKMKPLLDLICKRRCLPRIILLGDDPQGVHQIIDTLRHLTEPSRVEIVFEFTKLARFSTLIKEWPWPKPLHLVFPGPVFPLMWLNFVACLALYSISPSRILYTGPPSTDVVKTLAERLGVSYSPFSTRPGEIIVTGEPLLMEES